MRNLLSGAALLAVVVVGSASPVAATDKCGAVCDEVWDLAGSPYNVTCNVTASAACTLTVDAGVEVEFQLGTQLTVRGNFNVNGTSVDPVVFRSAEAVPAPGQWDGIRFRDTSVGNLVQAEIRDATQGLNVEDESSVTLTDVTSHLNNEGLFVKSAATATAVNVFSSGGRFIDNQIYGVHVRRSSSSAAEPNPEVTVTQGEIHSNLGTYDLYTGSAVWSEVNRIVLSATRNWWGTTDTSVIADRIFDHSDNSGRPIVDRCRFVDGPDGNVFLNAHCPDLAVCDQTKTLSLTNKPYHVSADFIVCPTGTLVIDDGVELRFSRDASPTSLIVEGTLNVNGLAGTPVIFDSLDVPAQIGDWRGLRLEGDAGATIGHLEVRHADVGIEIRGAPTATLDNVTAEDNGTGLRVQSEETATPVTVDVSDSSFINNVDYGIHIQRSSSSAAEPNPQVTVNGSAIHGNGGTYDVYTGSSTWVSGAETVLDFQGNWWGTTDAEQISLRLWEHADTDGRAVIDRCDFLDGPGGNPVWDAHCPELVACGSPLTLSLDDKPYLVTGDMWVCAGQTLTIESGVQMIFARDPKRLDLIVYGTVDVNGTADAPVEFTSGQPSPSFGDWRGIKALESATVELDHASFSHAHRPIDLRDQTVGRLSHVVSRLSDDGLILQASATAVPLTVDVADSTFADNRVHGIHIRRAGDNPADPNPQLTVIRSTIRGNGTWDLFTGNNGWADPDQTIVWAADNWWGSGDPSAISAGIFDHDDDPTRPRVYFGPFGDSCDRAIGGDADGDGLADFDDNCPTTANAAQTDGDDDGMGDACDPDPGLAPSGACDGGGDVAEGHLDSDGDGWGDPCDFQPTRADSYPGAVELCDGRDNDGDGLFGLQEDVDADVDGGLACGDCDELTPSINVCACENCTNTFDDNCDTLADGADASCTESSNCVILAAGPSAPELTLAKGACGGATAAGPYEVIRGAVGKLAINGASVDLGPVACVDGNLAWDRVTDLSADPNPACERNPASYYLARDPAAADFGSASTGEPRDLTDPDPACP